MVQNLRESTRQIDLLMQKRIFQAPLWIYSYILYNCKLLYMKLHLTKQVFQLDHSDSRTQEPPFVSFIKFRKVSVKHAYLLLIPCLTYYLLGMTLPNLNAVVAVNYTHRSTNREKKFTLIVFQIFSRKFISKTTVIFV